MNPMNEISPIANTIWRNKGGALLLIIQIAITLAIVSNAAFIINERLTTMARDSGLAEDQIFTFNNYFTDKKADIGRQIELDEAMIRAIPGVINAVSINQIPLSGGGDSSSFRTTIESINAATVGAAKFRGDQHLLETLGVTLVAGRNFTESDIAYDARSGDSKTAPDSANSSVGIVTQAFADQLFPQGDALGKNIYIIEDPIKIIGIIDHMQGPFPKHKIVNNVILLPTIPARQFKRYMVRTQANSRTEVMAEIEQKLMELSSDRVVTRIKTLNEVKAGTYKKDQLMSQMLLVLIIALLLVTALGIIGLAVFNVNRRTRQIGTRRALGAKKRDIVNYFICENTLLTCCGIVAGVVLSLILNDYLMTHYSLSKIDESYIVWTLAGIILLSVVAVFVPAQRAAKISPATATRTV